MNRDEAQGWLVQVLLDKVRNDPYPSTTQLQIIEEALPQQMVPDYLQVLMEKAAADEFPSIPLLRRIGRVAETLPKAQQQRQQRR
jgi:hypothetical protein